MDVEGRTALVTGAASGIGRGLAAALARRGAHLALADLDGEGLERTATEIEATGFMTTHRLDVTDAGAVRALPGELAAAGHREVALLVNNAGVAVAGRFEEVPEVDFDWLMAINFQAPVRLCRTFLPVLRKSAPARIVNISSIYGLIAPPGQAAYAASKFALRGFSAALDHELADSGVGVSVVHPGGVATAIAERARRGPAIGEAEATRLLEEARRLLVMDPARAGEIIARGIDRDRRRIFVGRDARGAALLERMFPESHMRHIARLTGVGRAKA
jgi:short-subunit dehydrogenase